LNPNLTKMKKITSISLVIMLLAGLFWGCEKKEDTPAPTLPPAGSMTIDFSNFGSKKSATAQNESNAFNDNTNWALAATIAGIWNTVLAVNLAVPVASFGAAVNTTPVFLGDATWEWKYDFNVVGATYKARLTGQVQSSDVKWKMYISKEGVGAFSELLWYEGTSALDGKSGNWVLNHSVQFPEPVLQIDWVADGTGVNNIKYTYIRDLKDDRTVDPFKTSYIEYGLNSTVTLNAFYNVHQNTGVQGVFNDVFIQWSTSGHNGHIKAEYYYQDDLWHCWNEVGENVVCE
jgi:hypothetical protein